MGVRSIVVIGALLALALCAPAAHAVSVTGITPSIGEGGVSLSCKVTGSFVVSDATTIASDPRFLLTNRYGTITGVTGLWDASMALVTFPLPLAAYPGYYQLQVIQDYRTGQLPVATASNTRPDAFRLFWVPALTSITPARVTAPSPDLTIVVNGARFINGGPYEPHSIVQYNGTALPTTFRTESQLTALISSASLATPGTASITVFNFSGFPTGPYFGATSDPVELAVTAPAPSITSIDPAGVMAGSLGFSLLVIGRDFLAGPSGAVVLWNGEPLVTTRDSDTRLTALVPAPLVATPGVATVSVRNGGAGAPPSAGTSFTIGNPVPVVTSVTPSVLWAGSAQPDIVLAVTGKDFVSGARVVLGTSEKAGTTFVDATRLTTPLVPADMATVGTLKVSVKNPPFPPGIASAGTVDLPVHADATAPTVTIAGADDAWHRKPVPLTFTATDTESGVRKVEFRAPPAVGAWTVGASYTVPVAEQGSIPVVVQAFDWCDRIGTAQATVRIDATRPGTQALGNVAVKRGQTAVLKYRVTEPAGLSPTADVIILVKDRGGATVMTLKKQAVPVNAEQAESFTCTLGKGRYAWYVYATDLAGNRQANVAHAGLTVR